MKNSVLGICLSIVVVAFVMETEILGGAVASAFTGAPVDQTSFYHEQLVISVDLPDAEGYRIVNRNKGQRIEMDGSGYLMVPGKPMLPAGNYLVALPPGARVRSVQVEGTGERQLAGAYQIAPTVPFLPADSRHPEIVQRMRAEWQMNNESTYASYQAYPVKRGELKGAGTLRKYSYASISVYPFSYHPASGRLIHYDSAQISIDYVLPSPGSAEAQRIEELKRDTVADERASRLFINFEDVKELYQPERQGLHAPGDAYDYVIVTTDSLSDAITSSNFVSWKESLGYRVKTILITDSQVAVQPGLDRAGKIRNFLRRYYGPWGIEYVLLVGSYETIPMRYCFPDPSNHVHNPRAPMDDSGEVPTDYYYADLSHPDSVSWDSDGDGYYGEYGQDSPDFLSEVYVGRIPTDNPDQITYTLDKLVAFEQDRGEWKDRALQAGAILYYDNEDYTGYGLMDGATCMNLIETNLMSDWTVSRYSEQEGLIPSEFEWSALNHEAFISDWRSGQYGVVNWAAHGSPNNVARKIWHRDDGDGVPETYGFPGEMHYYTFINRGSILDDDYPSILFAVSCLVGYPEPNLYGNMGIELLTKPEIGSSVGVLSSNRTAWIAIEWSLPLGGAESLCYEFNRYLIDGPAGPERIGEALYDSKYFCHQNYGWDHFAEYLNMYNYNLYGEPSMLREGVSESTAQDL